MDEIPDRDLLQDQAARRMRGIGWVLAVCGVLAGVALGAGVVASGGPRWAGLLVTVPIILLFGLLGWVSFRRAGRDPALFQGADRATQRAVGHALKAGGSDDPRVDALARDLAERNLRRPATPWVMTACLAFAAAGVLLSIIGGGFTLSQVSGIVGFGALLYVVINVWQTRKRSRRYPGVTP
jgi:hypothetical protein